MCCPSKTRRIQFYCVFKVFDQKNSISLTKKGRGTLHQENKLFNRLKHVINGVNVEKAKEFQH